MVTPSEPLCAHLRCSAPVEALVAIGASNQGSWFGGCLRQPINVFEACELAPSLPLTMRGKTPTNSSAGQRKLCLQWKLEHQTRG